ncbi:5015_t:CDS:2 [Funneliformis geosporum]|nr:5015_t:CDS:2 [Funneliformis geosporum]
MVKTQTTKNLVDDYGSENQDIEPDTSIIEQVITAGCREKSSYRKVSQAESSGREEIIMETSTIVTFSNKCREKGKQVIRPISTIPILITPMKLMRPTTLKNHDDYNNYDNDDENEDDMLMVFAKFINKSRFEDSEYFNAAGSMSSYAPMKCSLPTEGTCITELLQLTDSKEETDLDNDEQVTEHLSSKTGKPEAFREMTNTFKFANSSSVINMTTAISQTTKYALPQEEKTLA